MELPVYVVNLPEHEEEWRSVEGQLAKYDFLKPYRIVAINGGTLPDSACRLLTRNKWSVDHKGTLGCFLSHAKTWELIANSRYSISLVIEDDVLLGDMVSLLSLEIPDEFDLIFCNDRIAYPGVVGLRPTAPAIPFVIEQRRAFGSDGYLITKAGAIRLLELVEQDSFFAHVDMRLIAYSVTTEDAEGHASLGRLSANIAALRRTYPADHHVTAFSLYPPVVFHRHQASRRQKIDERAN